MAVFDSVRNSAGSGLRERKRKRTEELLMKVALRLFLEQGYEQTTLLDIANAADVAPRTLSNYYPSKEDLVAAWQDQARQELVDTLAEQSVEQGPLAAAEAAAMVLLNRHGQALNVLIARLVSETPALAARDQVKNAELEQALGAAIADRFEGRVTALEAELAAMIAIGAIRVASRLWVADGCREAVEPYANRIWDVLHSSVLTPKGWQEQARD